MKVWQAKDPDEEVRCTYDWSPDLQPGEVLVAMDGGGNPFPVVDPVNAAGTTISSVQQDDTTVTALIADGVDGQEALFTIRVHTSLNNTFEDTVALPIFSTVDPVVHPGDYSMPTVANLAFLFPEFANVRPSQVAYYLTQAARSVDTSWTQGDYGFAIMQLAAHMLTQAGLGATAEAASVNDGSNQFRSMGIGSLRLDRFDPVKDGSNLTGTRYGREFKRLRRANRGGARVTTGGVPGYDPHPAISDGDKAW